MQNLVSPSALAVIDQYITEALDANDRAALTGLRAALAALAVIATPTEISKIRARADAAARFVTEGRRHV